MSVTEAIHPLLASRPGSTADLPDSLRDELRELALRQDQLSTRSRQLFEQLRKMLGQDRLISCLLGIQEMAACGDPAGARLLAAYLDANTPGSQLLPKVQRFTSTSRLLDADEESVGKVFLEDWKKRLVKLVATCEARLGKRPATKSTKPMDRQPLPLLRQALTTMMPQRGSDPNTNDLKILAELIRLECDAYQERVSRLAGEIDPFRVTAVMRALPLLNRSDAEIRDLQRLVHWLEAGNVEAAFERRIPRFMEVLEDPEQRKLTAAVNSDPRLARLARIHEALAEDPPTIRQLAGPSARLLILGRDLASDGLREEPIHLLEALLLVLEHGLGGQLKIELTAELQEAVGRFLVAARRGGSDDLAGLEVREGALVLREPELGLGDRIWRHDLPTLEEMTGGAEEETVEPVEDVTEEKPDEDKSATAVKQLVMNNIGSVSILLGFLRNPAMTAIPGLVADVVRRTRSGRVIEVVAGERALTSGNANKEVPRALLESPVNVPVKTLRRFIHVKYVSKTDLKRMAKDKARLRKEVCQEIEKYLASLN